MTISRKNLFSVLTLVFVLGFMPFDFASAIGFGAGFGGIGAFTQYAIYQLVNGIFSVFQYILVTLIGIVGSGIDYFLRFDAGYADKLIDLFLNNFS